MRLSSKHTNTQTVTLNDFSGGLNLTNAPECIMQNELAVALNVEPDKTTGLLKTCCGTRTVLLDDEKIFTNLLYDSINKELLVTDSDKTLYKVSGASLETIGTISGNGTVEYASWESGVILASGGKLQYYDGTNLTVLNSPDNCHGVFVKDGRIYTASGDELHCSAIGDETDWENDPDDESSSQWLQIGYKDGGVITGICSLAQDIIIFKSNSHAYHLAGKFPDWQVLEIGRQIDCKSFNSCVSLANTAMCAGKSDIQTLSATDAYDEMRASSISAKVGREIPELPDNVKIRYIPPLNQVWFISGTESFLFVDINTGGFYHRAFSSPLADVVGVGGDVYVLKAHHIGVLNGADMVDEGENLSWAIQTKSFLSNNDYLTKRVRVDTTCLFNNYATHQYRIGKVVIDGGVPKWSTKIYHDLTQIYHSKRYIRKDNVRQIYSDSEEVYDNPEYIYLSDMPIRAKEMFRAERRVVDRNKDLRIRARGVGSLILIDGISFDIAEV